MVRVTDESGHELPQEGLPHDDADGEDSEEWWGKWRPWGQGESGPAKPVSTWV